MNEAETYLVETIKSFRGLKSNATKAIEQITDEELHYRPDPESNTVSIIIHHMAGNMLSRFTEFLTTDGEKEWRKRDEEFENTFYSRDDVIKLWDKGWDCLLKTLESLTVDDLTKKVFIRGESHTVIRALLRQLAHYAYHTGQIVYICKHLRSKEFKSLSIPRGQSGNYIPEKRS